LGSSGGSRMKYRADGQNMLNNSFPLFISLGDSCQTAYQIRRFTKCNDAYFFDWLITSKDAIKSIYAKDDDFFISNNWELVEFKSGSWEIIEKDGMTLRDKGTGLKFHHEFKRGESGFIDESFVEQHLPTAKSKFIYLKNKTLNAIKNAETVYLFRWEWIQNEVNALERIADINRLFSQTNKNIKVIIASPVANKEIIDGNQLFIKINQTENWQGDDNSWNRLFSIVTAQQD
jgi:hypothetical protein